jgi:hypothetical protein
LNFSLAVEFDEVVLYESHLATKGAQYDPIFRYPLEFMEYAEFYEDAEQDDTDSETDDRYS